MKKFLVSILVLGMLVGCAQVKQILPTAEKAAEVALNQYIQANEPTPTPAPTVTPTPPVKHYVVKKGDCLWVIAGKPSVLDDCFRWPLLYKANRDQILDPDIIEPAQDLSWNNVYSNVENDAAVKEAMDTPPYHRHSKPKKALPLKY